MKALLIFPVFAKSFWSFEKTLELTGYKSQLPPLGIITVAALLPKSWDIKLVDRNIREIAPEEWAWADMVMFSGMIAQRVDLLEQIREAKRRGKSVAVGGPYATALPEEVSGAGADFLVLDEAEITLPLFLNDLERGQSSGTYRSDGVRPDVTTVPIPRFDLLDLNAYAEMSVQFSRGCPFNCEFCDIIVLYGRRSRTKTPEQMLAELQALYDAGWRRAVFIVDDNFIGNRREVKRFLRSLKPWLAQHEYPFSFFTETSVDLAQDDELMRLMVECRFGTVFLGIETPDAASLEQCNKHQNIREPLADSVLKIIRAGLRVMGGFIIGFDGEQPGAGARLVDFVEQTTIPAAMLSMIQALPHTALWHRLKKEGRLLPEVGDVHQTTLLNFVPTRPISEIAREYVQAYEKLYDPTALLNRTYRHYLMLGKARIAHTRDARKENKGIYYNKFPLKALLTICWRQGVVRQSRWPFWRNLASLLWKYPAVVPSYLSVCAYGEHFVEYRNTVCSQIEARVAASGFSPAFDDIYSDKTYANASK